ncbi:hypothetical protein [Halobacteriovorax sp. HLS]|uniref:hypothetical protein n=1 Tax=Halobacteriovorax sp. HLS TaxID=2234000 RepID=UPI000FDAC044|nr:hypothetical protein [Halobacteriovorax sp. HLS]
MKSLLVLLLTLSAHGYENMIVKGYSSCIACHKSAEGGGLLTEYGKYISNTSSYISSKNFKTDQSRFNYALQFRYAKIDANGSKRSFPMQSDILTNINFKEAGEVFIDIARAPESQAIASGIEEPKQSDLWFFRKAIYHYKNFFIGRQRFNLGLNLVDHTTLNKSLNRMNVSDLASTIGLLKVTKDSSKKVFLFGPSFQENRINKETGIAVDYRKYISKNLNVGGFSYYSLGETIDRGSIGLNFKATISKWALFYEGVYSRREFKKGSSLDQNSSLIRLSFFPYMSTLIFINYEFANRNKNFELEETRVGFGTRLKIWKWISFQYDLKKIERNSVEENISIAQLFLNIWG